MYKLTINKDSFSFNDIESLSDFIKEFIIDVHSDKNFHEYEFSVNKECIAEVT